MLSDLRAFSRTKVAAALLGPSDAPQDTSTSADVMRAALESTVSETHTWASAVAVITSAVNGLTAPVTSDWSAEIEDLLPKPTPVSRALVAGLLDVPLTDETAASIAALIARVSASKNGIRSFCDDVTQLGHGSAALLHGSTLGAQWSGVARMAANTLSDIDAEVSGELDPRYSASSQLLVGLLQNAAGGAMPCLDDHGMPVAPQLPQRRRTPRIGLLQSCTVNSPTRRFDAYARDISRGGLGLQNTQSLTVGEYVRISLEHGRTFEGRVAWSDTISAGVTFAEPLDANDPLLAI